MMWVEIKRWPSAANLENVREVLSGVWVEVNCWKVLTDEIKQTYKNSLDSSDE